MLTGSPVIGDASYPCRKQRTTKEVFGADAGGTTHGRKICDVRLRSFLPILHAAISLTLVSQLLWTRKERDCMQSLSFLFSN